MNRYFLSMICIGTSVLLCSCGTSDSAIQTAIASTAGAITPTETATPIPTGTPTVTTTPSPTATITPTNSPEPAPMEERIIGEWSGAMTNKNGDKLPAIWTFLDNGVMVVEVSIGGFSYGATWYFEGNRIYITTELDPNVPTYRDVEFVTDDLMILTKEESNIRETWIRGDSESSQ